MADDALARSFLDAVETHDAHALATLLAAGLDAASPVRGKLPVQWLLEMYLRSPRFAACLQLLLDRGACLEDPRLQAVLLDDAATLTAQLRADPRLLGHRVSMVSAFTPLLDATLLHVAAEYGCANAVDALLAAGADVEARAAADEGEGHTPLFHTVNTILDHGKPILRRLLAAGARTDVRVARLVWGRGFDWETTFYDLTPISYCQLGLLPQMHRRELDIHGNLQLLLAAAQRPAAAGANLPNRYLQPRQ